MVNEKDYRCPVCGSMNYKEKSEYVLECQECGEHFHKDDEDEEDE